MAVRHYNYNLLPASVTAHGGAGFQTTEAESKEDERRDACVHTWAHTHTHASPIGSFVIHDAVERGAFSPLEATSVL